MVQKLPEMIREGMGMAVHSSCLVKAKRQEAEPGWSRRRGRQESSIVITLIKCKGPEVRGERLHKALKGDSGASCLKS